MKKFDLHMHSALSPDGEKSLEELAEMAAAKGMDVISLTDHDRIAGVAQLRQLAALKGIEVIPGIECSTMYGDENVHVLGYGIDLDSPYFLSLADRVKGMSAQAFEKRYARMKEKYGFQTTLEEVMEDAQGKSPWFSLFRLILQEPEIQAHPDFQPYLPGGSRADPAPVNFYWDHLQAGSDLYVRTGYPDIFDTIDEIHKAGGLAFVAHPFHTFEGKPEKLKVLKDYGLDGLEAYSNYHTPAMNEQYRQMAEDLGLLISCGSDYHGIRKPSIEMGEYGLEDGTLYLEALQKALAEKRPTT